VGHAQRDRRRIRLELPTDPLGNHDAERHVAGLELRPLLVRELVAPNAQRLAVELRGTLDITNCDTDHVGALDSDQPTEPSIWSWISRFISTAYSSGSSFVIGSTKPLTIIALASASESPRDIR